MRQGLALVFLAGLFLAALTPVGTATTLGRSRAIQPLAGPPLVPRMVAPAPSTRPVPVRPGAIPRLLILRALDKVGRTLVRETLLVDPRGLVRMSGGEAVIQGLTGDALVHQLRPVVARRFPGVSKLYARIVPGIVIQAQGSSPVHGGGFPTGPHVVPAGTTLAGLLELLPMGRGDDPRRVTCIHAGKAHSVDMIEVMANTRAVGRTQPLQDGDWVVVAGRAAAVASRGPYVFGAVHLPGRYTGHGPTIGRVLARAHVEAGQRWVYVLTGWRSSLAVHRYQLRGGRLAAVDSLRILAPDDIVVVGGARVPRALTDVVALLIPIGGDPRAAASPSRTSGRSNAHT